MVDDPRTCCRSRPFHVDYLSKLETRFIHDYFWAQATRLIEIAQGSGAQPLPAFNDMTCATKGPQIERDVLNDARFVKWVGRYNCADFMKSIRGNP